MTLQFLNLGPVAQPTLSFGRTTIAVTNTLQALGTTTEFKNGVTVKAPLANNQPIYVGNNSDGFFPLYPGEREDFYIIDISHLYLKGTAGDTVDWKGN